MREAGVMLIINTEGKILGVSRRSNKELFGLPGGKKEPFESTMEAAIRETKEETSVEVKSCIELYKRVEPASDLNGEDFHSYCYYAMEWSGFPKDMEEGMTTAWLTLDELVNTKAAFGDYNKSTLDSFRKMFPSIYLKD